MIYPKESNVQDPALNYVYEDLLPDECSQVQVLVPALAGREDDELGHIDELGQVAQQKDLGGLRGSPAAPAEVVSVPSKSAISALASLKPKVGVATSKQVKGGKANTKDSAKKEIASKVSKAKRTLQDDQKNVNKKFAVKIMQSGLGYRCKSCTFQTGLLLRAKTHALSCGGKKKKICKRKQSLCPECVEKFDSKAKFNEHFKTFHQNSNYTCSKCFHNYTRRKTYMLHLKTHDADFISKFKCERCEYKARDKWLLDRHFRNKHVKGSEVISKELIEELLKSIVDNTANSHTHRPFHLPASCPSITLASRTNTSTSTTSLITGTPETKHGRGESVGRHGKVQGVSGEGLRIGVEEDMDVEVVDWAAQATEGGVGEGGGAVGDEGEGILLFQNKYPSSQSHTIGPANFSVISPARPSKELCEWEKIRMSIISERQKAIEESGVLKDLFEAKEALGGVKKKPMERVQTKDTERRNMKNILLRRSTRLQENEIVETVASDTDMVEFPAHVIKIDVEIKEEPMEEIELESEAVSSQNLIRETETEVEAASSLTEPDVEVTQNHETESGAVSSQTMNATATVQNIIDEILREINDPKSSHHKKYRCIKCEYKTKDNFNLQRHQSIMHTNSLIKCTICYKIFPDKFSYTHHNPSCFFSCPYLGCSKKFKILIKFESHKRAHIKFLERMA